MRNKVLKYGLLACVGFIALRLFWIQIIQHDEWMKKAEDAHIVQSTITAERGEIYMLDEDGEPTPVVMNQAEWTVIIDPMVANAEEVKKVITENVAEEEIVADWDAAFANKNSRYYIVAKGVSRSEVKKIEEAEVSGIWYTEGNKRTYVEGEMASHLLGFVNDDGEGQYGVEGSLNDDLAGKDGLLKTVTDVNQIALSIGDDNIKVPAEDGKNVVLTVDRTMQKKVEEITADYLEEKNIENASVLVMNPNNGKILTMATLPNYDPSDYGMVEDAESYLNVPAEVAYEPASICKTFTFAAAINEGVMTPETTYVNTGSITVDGWPIDNAYSGQLGTITMQTGLNYSLNTSSMTALMLLGGSTEHITQSGREKLYDYFYSRFGLGQYTGIELNESSGLIVGPNEGTGLNSRYANMTFGQNLNLTMIQVAAGFSSVINGGKYYTPTIVAGEMDGDVFVEDEEKDPVRTVISEETSETMREMLYGTRIWRRQDGTDKDGYYVGGKTGTAQVIVNGSYSMDETTAGYIGFGSAEGDMPEYVIMVRVWEDGKNLGGESDAMPLFNKINEMMLDYLEIEPKE